MLAAGESQPRPPGLAQARGQGTLNGDRDAPESGVRVSDETSAKPLTITLPPGAVNQKRLARALSYSGASLEEFAAKSIEVMLGNADWADPSQREEITIKLRPDVVAQFQVWALEQNRGSAEEEMEAALTDLVEGEKPWRPEGGAR